MHAPRTSSSFANFQTLEAGARKTSNHWKSAAALAALLFGLTLRTSAVVLASETFDVNDAGWTSRDPLEMTTAFSGGFGNPAGSLQGTFGSQVTPAFESDAFRVSSGSSGGAFSGNLYLSYASFSSVSFSFYAEDVLPSTFILRVGNGTNTFLYNLTPQLTTTATWMNVSASLSYSAGWIGGTAAQFSNVFAGVNFFDVQVARNGTGVQDYFLDNFNLNSIAESLSIVPEPASFGLILLGIFALYMARKRRRDRALMVRNEKR